MFVESVVGEATREGQRKTTQQNTSSMKHSFLTKASIAVLLGTLIGAVVLAQTAPPGRGRNQAAPAAGQQRGPRAAECPTPSCPKSGACPAEGQGSGNYSGKGQQGVNSGTCPNPGQRGMGCGRGLRDGTGPRSQNGTCPSTPATPSR